MAEFNQIKARLFRGIKASAIVKIELLLTRWSGLQSDSWLCWHGTCTL